MNLPKTITVRYLTDDHLEALTARHGRETISRAVAAHLDAHPEDFTAPRINHRERHTRQAARNARADAHLSAALHHHNAAQPYETLALIDRAELASPTYKDFDRFRRAVHGNLPPLTPTDLTGTNLRHRATLPLAYPHPGPPVMYYGSTARRWVYPGHRVIEGNWPAAIPEHCTATDDELMEWNIDGTVHVCTGCGLDWT
ncbi:hypothetical protein ACGF5C_27210 [Micromonospora sp. NPDC047620]|uniref:hypothetical protein n=1 Tax=Micromonospora sp. NPDC047620 TaxID=3364251 RepID=UPI00371D192E